MKIAIASRDEVDTVWPLIAARVQQTCETYGADISAPDLWSMCRRGDAFLTVIMDDDGVVAAWVFRFERWSNKTVVRFLCLVGERMNEWLPGAVQFMTEIAKSNGATAFVEDGRHGWGRVLSGARRLRVTYIKEIE